MRCSGRLATAVSVAALLASAAKAGLEIQDQKPKQEQPQTEIQKAVQEFKELTRELGLRPDSPKRRSRGSSGPSWHGRVFENFRNDFLDAVPHEVTQRGESASMLRRNQFGVNVGGPVVIPWLYNGGRRTYFSFSYEGVREKVSRSSLRTIPTLPERTGDWSETVDAAGKRLPIYDPLSTRPNPAYDPSQPVSTDNLQYIREPFPDNWIPRAQLDPVALAAAAYYPAPNANGGPFFQNNFFVHSPEANTANGVIAKLDHTLSERHRLSFSLNYSNGVTDAAAWFDNAANPGPLDSQFRSRRGSAEWVFTLSPRTLHTLTFEASSNTSESGRSDGTDYPALLGLNGARGKVFPAFWYEEYVGLGRGYPESRNVRNEFTLTDGLSIRRGDHTVQITARYSGQQVNTYSPSYPSGELRFSEGLTSLPGIVNTGHGFASFLLGGAEYARLGISVSPSYFRDGQARLSLNDSWEVRNGLTLTFSANVEHHRPRIEKYNRMSTVDLRGINPANGRPGALVVAGENGYGRSFQPSRTRVEPSAGLAWNPRGDTRTVVRASFGRYYSPIPIYFGQWGTQAFNTSPTWISPNVQLEPALRLRDGFPPTEESAGSRAGDAANDTVAHLMDMSDRLPVHQWANLSVERELPGSVLATAGFSYSGGKDILVGGNSANLNAIRLEALRYRDLLNDEEFNRSLRPYPQYKGFDVGGMWPLGRYHRKSAFVRVERRASGGLVVGGSYEYIRQWDDYSGPGRQNFFDRREEWALTAWLSPHRFSFTYVYELPLGAGKPFLSLPGWRRHLVDGWSLSGASMVNGGNPLILRPMFNNTGGVVTSLRVNVVPGVNPAVPNPGPQLWFNPAAFDQPPDFTTGNASRTHPTLRGPIFQNHDLSLTKRFALRSDRTVEFSAVGLNWLNHANWSEPDTEIGPASSPNVNAGRIIESRGGRVVQLGVRITF